MKEVSYHFWVSNIDKNHVFDSFLKIRRKSRRHTRKLETITKSETDIDRHTRATKSSIQRLEMKSKKKINEIIDSCKLEVKSNTFDKKELGRGLNL